VCLRIDSIEQAIRDSGAVGGRHNDMGYRVGYSVAEDDLYLGRLVIADSVNPVPLTRDAWLSRVEPEQKPSKWKLPVLIFNNIDNGWKQGWAISRD
jgi:predicted kinase